MLVTPSYVVRRIRIPGHEEDVARIIGRPVRSPTSRLTTERRHSASCLLVVEPVRRKRLQRSRRPPQQPAPRKIRRKIAEAAKPRIDTAVREQQPRTLPLVRRVEIECRSIGQRMRRRHHLWCHLVGQTSQIERVQPVGWTTRILRINHHVQRLAARVDHRRRVDPYIRPVVVASQRHTTPAFQNSDSAAPSRCARRWHIPCCLPWPHKPHRASPDTFRP